MRYKKIFTYITDSVALESWLERQCFVLLISGAAVIPGLSHLQIILSLKLDLYRQCLVCYENSSSAMLYE